jgi:general secretion pathway protein M
MIGAELLKRLNRDHAPAAWLYIGLVLGFCSLIWLSLAGLLAAYDGWSGSAARLELIEGHSKSGGRPAQAATVAASPFLEGPTVTIAGADLQRRVAAAVSAVGGAVLSSQIDLQGSQARQGYVVVSASCELGQTALQPLLYDLEAGLPFLFVEQLVVQAPQSAEESEGKRMRVQIDVAGQWQVAK